MVEACAEEEQTRINAIKDGGKRTHEVYAMGIDNRKCFSCNKVGHLTWNCSEKKRPRNQEQDAETNLIMNWLRERNEEACRGVRYQQKRNLATACPYQAKGFNKKRMK